MAIAMLVTYPLSGRICGRLAVDVTRLTRFGVYLCDAITRLFMHQNSKLDIHLDDDISDGNIFFNLLEQLSVSLRPLVHPGYYETLKK